MHWDDMLNAEKADGAGGVARAYSVEVADGKHSDVRFVEFADQFHVAEEGGVAGMIDRKAALNSNDESGRFAAVDSNAVVVDGVRMEAVGHCHLIRADGLSTAFSLGADFLLEAFFC